MQIVQLKTDAVDPLAEQHGYEFQTDRWGKVTEVVNLLIEDSALKHDSAEELIRKANIVFDRQPEVGQNGVNWAEFTMSINHLLWIISALFDKEKIEYLEPVLEALDKLYYQWHDNALKTLKGNALSDYLKITD